MNKLKKNFFGKTRMFYSILNFLQNFQNLSNFLLFSSIKISFDQVCHWNVNITGGIHPQNKISMIVISEGVISLNYYFYGNILFKNAYRQHRRLNTCQNMCLNVLSIG